jgi:hypothetical protein
MKGRNTTMKIAYSNILTAFDAAGVIGSKVTNHEAFLAELGAAVAEHDFAEDRVPGQGFVHLGERVNAFVSAGVGSASADPADYVLREHRGRVSAFLRRELAAPVEGCAAIVYTAEAYLADPEVDAAEADALQGATHVLVAVLAFAGPESSLTPFRLVSNLAGGNKEAKAWSADEIRTKAEESSTYWGTWAAVADDA